MYQLRYFFSSNKILDLSIRNIIIKLTLCFINNRNINI